MATQKAQTKSKSAAVKTAKKGPVPKAGPPASWVGRVPMLRPGNYADGLPIHDVQYLCCKLILRPNPFVSRESLFEFGDVLRAAGEGARREVLDEGLSRQSRSRSARSCSSTPHDFRLYNNAFILRRRIPYQDGFPVGDPEIVFKFRHPDMQMAAETDVRPQIRGDHRVKFKCQALPLKEKLGGIRLLFSHNVQFPRSAMGIGARERPQRGPDGSRSFRCSRALRKEPGEKIELVSETIIEEVLQDIGAARFRRRADRQDQRRDLAHARRASSADRGVRLPGAVRGPQAARPAGPAARWRSSSSPCSSRPRTGSR